MRYSVRFPVLLRCCDELEKTARQHIREIDELRQTRQSLSRLSGMDGVVAGIDRELAEMEDQRRVLLAMAQAVRRAHQIYTDTENTIIEEADCPYHALTELKLSPDGGAAGFGPVWKIESSVSDSTSQCIVTEVQRLDIKTCAALLSEMDVIVKAAR